MNKVTILCAMENGYETDIFMRAVERSLQAEHVSVVRVNMVHKVIETRHTRTAFMWDIRQRPLDGILADALFGKEPYKQVYRGRLKVYAPYDVGMGLLDYICAVENKYNMIDAIDNAKRIMINSRYGKMGEWKYEELPNGGFEMMYKPDYKIEKMDIDEWPKSNPYLWQNAIYASMVRHNGKTMLKQAFLEYYDYLKYANTPISQQLKETAEYCRKDVEMTSFLYKNFNMSQAKLPEIKNVIFNEPATIVMWADGTKTVVQCLEGDTYDPEKGLAMAISKKVLGNKHDYYHTFKHWLKRYKKEDE